MGTEHHSDGSNNLDVLDEDEKDEDSGKTIDRVVRCTHGAQERRGLGQHGAPPMPAASRISSLET